MSHISVTKYDYSDQPPRAELIGEAIHEVLKATWRRGFDPASKDFVLLVSFN